MKSAPKPLGHNLIDTAQGGFAATDSGLAKALGRIAQEMDAQFAAQLTPSRSQDARLLEAMRYACIGGGKRLRPLLVVEVAALFQIERAAALPTATALEAVHIYSLIHDDLPAMDDDDMRRGKPSLHKAFDEATAILAGDALLTFAFKLLAEPHTHPQAETRLALITCLADAAGAKGMVAGQMLDMYAHSDIATTQKLKTGAVIAASVQAGALLGGADAVQSEALRSYAEHIGAAFQIMDDVLDVVGDAASMGKTLGKDAAQGKQTFVTLLGLNGAQEKARAHITRAKQQLASFGQRAAVLYTLADYIITRES